MKLLIVVCAFATSGLIFAGKGDFKVAPGPVVISEEERAIAPDPNKGMEHGIVLLEEIERDERQAPYLALHYHMRAKILSNEGRGLADVEIPLNTKSGQLKRWWGKVICLDGKFGLLKQEELKRQVIQKGGVRGVEVLKGTIPGVGPGCILDYGYDFWDESFFRLTRISLQRRWPVREMRYRWLTYTGLPAGYRMTHADGLDVEASREGQGVLLVARNLPAIVEEPLMPVVGATRAMATTYYMARNTNTKDFWNVEAKEVDRLASSFTSAKAARELIAQMNLPQGADLEARLKAAYDWIASNIKNRGNLTAEEEEKEGEEEERDERKKDEKDVRSAADLINVKEGSGWQITYLFIGVARALGAEASIVRATDRTDHYWDPLLLTLYQFDRTMAAVRAPGDPDEKATIVAPSSGLPYGQIPWWLTGTNGWLATAKGGREIRLPPSSLRENLMDAKARIRFDDDGTTRVIWSATMTGQQGYLEWLSLRDSTAEERAKSLDEACGASGEFEVTKSGGPELGGKTAGYRLECEGEWNSPGTDETSSSFSFPFDGPWTGDTPELTASTRVHPVVFDFPWVDRATIEIDAPPGFAPVAAPAPITIEVPFARYTVTFTVTPGGYRVEREHRFTPLLIMPVEYPMLREYLAQVRLADRTRLDFRRKEGGS